MKRPFAPLLLCAVLALAAAPAAAVGQDVEQPPQELWDEFPLEPTATPEPTEARAEATPSRAVEAPDEGMGSGALIALLVAAGGTGAIAARLATRRRPRATPDAPPAKHEPATSDSRTAAKPPSTPTIARPAPAPPRAGTGRPAGRFAPGGGARASGEPSSGCSIKLAKRPPVGRFVAVADSGGGVLARSPVFKLKRDEGDTGSSPPDALRTLVEELIAAGWRKTGAGRAPWELRFERDPQPAARRRASPPRA